MASFTGSKEIILTEELNKLPAYPPECGKWKLSSFQLAK